MSARPGPGRTEGELDPEAGPLPRFAAELRALRESAGKPTYRAMAQQARYGVTTLSQAAAGKQLPTRAVTLAYVKACGGDVIAWERRWREVSAELAAQAADDETSRPPYRGLTRFEPGDAELFFGRDQLVERLTELNRKHRFTAVFGPSGSGKSSLLRAGLIPRLRTPDDGEEDVPPAAIRILTPGADPLRTHADRLLPVPGTDADTWLIVDQFEELYTLGADPADRDTFIDRLVAATDADSRLRVVIAVRADFLGRCAEHPGLTAALQDATLLAGPMSRAELREAIVRPAAADGLIVERSLTDRLLDEVEGAPGGLPLMSHALLETWRHRSGRALTETAYEAAGGLHGAVVRTAEQVYGELTAPQAELARRILLRLVAPGDGTPDTRRPTEHAELDFGMPADTRVVLERLIRARLITFDDGTVDLAHEALITAWPRLRAWIDAERDRLRVHRSLSEAARTWQALGRESAALYAGSRLHAARDAFPKDAARPHGASPGDGRSDELTPLERQFLTASIRRRHRAARLRRTVVAVLAALVLLATGTAVVALQAREAAQAERDEAVFGRLTAEADRVRETDSGLAARLDVAAYRMRSTPDLRTRLASDAGRVLATRLSGHRGLGSSVAYAPDGRTLASGGHDGTVRLWDTTARPGSPNKPEDMGRTLGKPLRLSTGPVGAVAFAPADGDMLVATGKGGGIQLWDVRDRERPRPVGRPLVSHDEANVVSVAFAPDGRTLATAGDDGTVRLWDLSDPARPAPLGEPAEADDSEAGSVRAVAFAPDGETLATGGYDGTVRMWQFSEDDGTGLTPLGKPLREHTASVWTLAFSPDGRTLATAGYDETVRLWGASDPSRLEPLGEPLTEHTAPVMSVAFSPDGETLASAGEDDSPILWNVANPAYPQQLGEPLTGHTEAVWDVAFHPDGRTLASTGADGSVRLWHRPPTVLTDFTNPLTAVAYSPDGRLLAAASTDDGLIRLWDVADPGNPRRLLRTLTGHEDEVLSVAFAPDGRAVAGGSKDGTVRLWDVADPEHPAPLGEPLDAHDGGALAVAFAPDGRALATGGEDDTVRLWDVRRPDHVRPLGEPLRGHTDAVTSLAFAPGSRTLATGSEDNTARLWHVGEGGRAGPAGAALTGHDETVNAVAFAPDGKTLATGSDDRTARLWDVEQADRVRPVGEELAGHRGPVRSVAFAPDGKTLATGSGDHTVRLWDVADPARAEPAGQELTGHIDTVTSVAFSPEGDALASAGYDLTARVWTLDGDRAADYVCDRTGGVLTRAEWEEHLPQLGYQAVCVGS
ncbi:WD40 repeat domain-containing protein [Streptomyces sp. PSKA54]|uniref:WD40 repeat domain-containing protein n=1 Tax=Streptomyces himalayensis subsp. aureolus TaxID=2758039 RepID=A0A7W2D1U2_9ACTN|nr:WD40 repeat domain-containing protein [Streptomyces himalayensis]MBA4863079.1 WD40 repeat domain-containing protein [Streptomyces himalayensis subsp. aureolus]